MLPEISQEPEDVVDNDVERENKFQLLTPQKTQAIETVNASLLGKLRETVNAKHLREKKYPEKKKVTEVFVWYTMNRL